MTAVLIDDLHLAPEPERYLAQRVEAARPDKDGPGRIIVRCPDRASNGIRALRSTDVAAMLMRHGRILELKTTPDGTIVAAAEAQRRRGNLAIWTGYAIGPWMPSDIVQRGLGGSETAAVRLAESLAAMGWTVTLYGQFAEEGCSGDVLLRDFRAMDWTAPLDALIAFRDARPFEQRPNATFTALWLEDLPGQEQLTPERAKNIDRICAVSHFHKRVTEEKYPWLCEMKDPRGHDLVAPCRNGINHPWFSEEPAPEREKRVVYSSSPDRGGDIILEVWPQVRERVPDAELILTYSRWYDLCAAQFGETPAHRKLIELVEQDGVHRVSGGLGQKALANLMRSSLVWAHPSWWTAGDQEFHETSCISAMEAQAAGCVVVASNWGALSETVAYGTLIDGDPREPEGAWRKAFVDAIVAGLTDTDVQDAAQLVGPEMVREMDWRGAAEQLASFFPEGPGFTVDEDLVRALERGNENMRQLAAAMEDAAP